MATAATHSPKTTTQRQGRKRSGGSASAQGRTTHGDAIAVLKADHRQVEEWFTAFEKAGATAYKTKRKLVDRIIAALSQHAAIEEEEFYPAVRTFDPVAEDQVLEALEEHHIVKWELQELVDLDPKDERFTAKVTVLIENVRHHVKEEEGELFPSVREAMTRAQLQEIADRLEQARRTAPTRPHPRSPDQPPAGTVSDVVAGVIDKAREMVHPSGQGR
jgi:hemerythrin superfamily protein